MAAADAKAVVKAEALVKAEFVAKGMAEVVATVTAQQFFLSQP